MGLNPRLHPSWLTLTVLLAAINVVHALYFDWSDVDVHVFIALLCVLAALRWPRPAAGAAGFIVFMVALGSFVVSELPEWTKQVQRGDKWTAAQQKLGDPTYQTASASEARRLDIGYSAPSPLLFKHRGPVAIFVRGEYALWVFRNGDTVVDTFVAGS